MSNTVVLVGHAGSGVERRLASLTKLAAESGGDVRFVFVDGALPLEQVAAACGAAPVLVVLGFGQTEALAERLPALRLVQTYTAGTDWLDIGRLARLDVKVADNNGANAVAVAEHTMGLIVALLRKLAQQFASARAGNWQEGIDLAGGPYRTLVGKRVGLVGLGRIGGRVARRLAGWECEVVYCDNKRLDPAYVASTGAAPLDFDTLLQTADVVSLHVPLNRLTRGFFGGRELGLMKPAAVLINTCRGPVVDEKALIQALAAGRISGAGLDVTDPEPIAPDNPLLQMANVIITPHLGARAVESGINAERHVVQNCLRVLRGEEPAAVVEPV